MAVSRVRTLGGATIAALAVLSAVRAAAQPETIAVAEPLHAAAQALRVPSPAEIDVARREARESLAALRANLEPRAIGVVLARDLQLDRLAMVLATPAVDSKALDDIERSLRRQVAGDAKHLVDRLRTAVMRLARLTRLAATPPVDGRRALETIARHLGDPALPAAANGDDALRAAFATLASLVPDEQVMTALRDSLSSPNEAVFVGHRFVETVSRKSLALPVGSRQRREGTLISGTGSLRVDLAATLPPAEGASVVRMHAVGTGQINATADRRRAHVRAQAVPELTGFDDVRILWDRIVEGEPHVDARFRTQLTSLRVDNLLGRCRLVKNMVGRTIQERLVANDPSVARNIEREVGQRVKEESVNLAYRINGLLKWGVWDRLEAVDFTPAVKLRNDAAGAHSGTWYAGAGQLGAFTPRPPLPLHPGRPFAVGTWLHESAINNTFARLGGMRLDEATVRSLWEVQCKLTCDEWADLAPARIPSVITLADDRPLAVRFVHGGFDARVRMQGGTLAGRPVAAGPFEATLRYRVSHDATGPILVREALEWAEGTPAAERDALEQAVGLFLGRTIRPLPRYRPPGFAKYVQLTHLELKDGWLVVGATEVGKSVAQSPERAAAAAPASSIIPPAPVPPPAATDLATRFAPMELLFCFQGKGSCLPYDGGVLHEAYARIPAFRQGRVIVAGNSSGSIPAGYFSCHGFNDATVCHAEERLKYGNREAVRTMENVNTKITKLSRGEGTEIEHVELREFVAFALGVSQWHDTRSIDEIVRRSRVRPVHPCLIVACNKEVLEDVHPQDRFAPGRLKEFDPATMRVSWKPEVHDWYRRHPERFRQDHPDLVLNADRTIGRGVTFFVDRSMYDLLSHIPAEERIADLRLMTDAADVALAILASASEPTYFPVVVDPQPEKILAADGGDVRGRIRKRTYYGGYIISMPAHDVRRMLPGIRVLGTGWRHNPLFARTLLKNWLLADCEEVAQRSEWWADMEINPDAEFESHIEVRGLSGAEEFAFGQRRAREVFDAGGGRPAFVKVPQFHTAAAAAIAPATLRPDMYADELGSNGKRPLKTLRGLGPLLSPASAE